MRILHTVESYHPALGGMQEVVKQLSERLVKLGHDVTVATSYHPAREGDVINGVRIKSFRIKGNLVRGMEGETEEYKKFLLESDFDVVTNFAAQQWATDIAIENLGSVKGKKVFVPTGFSGLYWKEYAGYFEKMKSWMKQYDMNVFLSDNYRDINFARENGITKNIIIPNGAGEDEFQSADLPDIRKELGVPTDAFLVLHVGSYSGIKGHVEVVSIFLKAAIPNSVLLLIGNNNEIFSRRMYYKLNPFLVLRYLFNKTKIKITSHLNRKQTVAAYKSADVFLFPSNIECSPIVLFESMASRTPFLTADVGNSAEIISWSHGGLILPTKIDEAGFSHVDINESVRMLKELYENKAERAKLASDGYNSWKEKFTWEVIGLKYESMYKNLISAK